MLLHLILPRNPTQPNQTSFLFLHIYPDILPFFPITTEMTFLPRYTIEKVHFFHHSWWPLTSSPPPILHLPTLPPSFPPVILSFDYLLKSSCSPAQLSAIPLYAPRERHGVGGTPPEEWWWRWGPCGPSRAKFRWTALIHVLTELPTPNLPSRLKYFFLFFFFLHSIRDGHVYGHFLFFCPCLVGNY